MPRNLLSLSSRLFRRKKPTQPTVLKKTNSERPLFKPYPNGITKNDYYYDEDGAPRSHAQPVGFLSFVDSDADPLGEMKKIPRSPCDKIAYQFQLLCDMFPDFPRSMMRALLAREHGDGRAVFSELVSHGWLNAQDFQEYLTAEEDIFNILHFWGEMRHEYLFKLSSYPPGSYFVAFLEPGTYVICCVNFRNEVEQRHTSTLFVLESHKRLFSLQKAVPRPENVNPNRLLPFLV